MVGPRGPGQGRGARVGADAHLVAPGTRARSNSARATLANASTNSGEVFSDSIRAKSSPAVDACSRAPTSMSYRISR